MQNKPYEAEIAEEKSEVSDGIIYSPAKGRDISNLKEYLNYALKAAFGTQSLAKSIKLTDDIKSKPFISPLLSDLTGQESYIISGYALFGEAIKGHAALGYFYKYASPTYNELIDLKEKATGYIDLCNVVDSLEEPVKSNFIEQINIILSTQEFTSEDFTTKSSKLKAAIISKCGTKLSDIGVYTIITTACNNMQDNTPLSHYNSIILSDDTTISAKANFRTRIENFLTYHGVQRGLNGFNGKVDKIDPMHIALWETYRSKPLICPSSGSFALSFLDTLEYLRTFKIKFDDGSEIPLFMPKTLLPGDPLVIGENPEGQIILWLPDPGTDVMPIDKYKEIAKKAKHLKCIVRNWSPGTNDYENTREPDSMNDALLTGGFYCSTNPKSIQEIGDKKGLMESLFRHKGARMLDPSNKDDPISNQIYMNAISALNYIGIKCENTPTSNGPRRLLTISEPMDAGVFGLMLAKLEVMETLLANKSIIEETTYNQPSAGSTLAACAIVNLLYDKPKIVSPENMVLLQFQCPHIHEAITSEGNKIKSLLKGCYDEANPKLADELGVNVEAAALHNNGRPENGLGAFSTSKISVNLIKQAMGDAAQESMLICPHGIMEISRVILFLSSIEKNGIDALYPESAAAAGIGGWLYKEIIEGKKTGKDIALVLKNNGVTEQIFNMLINQEALKQTFELNFQSGKLNPLTNKINPGNPHHGKIIHDFYNDFIKTMSEEPIKSVQETKSLESKSSSGLSIPSTQLSSTQQVILETKAANDIFSPCKISHDKVNVFFSTGANLGQNRNIERAKRQIIAKSQTAVVSPPASPGSTFSDTTVAAAIPSLSIGSNTILSSISH